MFDERTEEGLCGCGAPGTRTRYRWRGTDWGEPGPFRCPACQEKAEAEAEAQEIADHRERCEQRAAERFAYTIHGSWIPKALRVDEEPYGRPNVLADARRWAHNEIPALLLVGPPGTGKTYMAAWAAMERMRTLRQRYIARALELGPRSEYGVAYPSEVVRWVSVPQLFNWLARPFESDERERAMKVIDGRGPLILDDIDKARATEYGAEQVFLMVDNAINNERPLVVTANRPVGALEAMWPINGSAIASRLAGYCTQHLLKGDDRRLQRRQAA